MEILLGLNTPVITNIVYKLKNPYMDLKHHNKRGLTKFIKVVKEFEYD